MRIISVARYRIKIPSQFACARIKRAHGPTRIIRSEELGVIGSSENYNVPDNGRWGGKVNISVANLCCRCQHHGLDVDFTIRAKGFATMTILRIDRHETKIFGAHENAMATSLIRRRILIPPVRNTAAVVSGTEWAQFHLRVKHPAFVAARWIQGNDPVVGRTENQGVSSVLGKKYGGDVKTRKQLSFGVSSNVTGLV